MSEIKVDTISESTGSNGIFLGHAIVEKQNAVSITSNTLGIDASDGGLYTVTVNANISTFNITNMVSGQAITVIFTNDGTGGYTVTTSISVNGASAAAIKTAGGAGWTMTTTASAIDIVTFVWDGTNLYAVAQQAWS